MRLANTLKPAKIKPMTLEEIKQKIFEDYYSARSNGWCGCDYGCACREKDDARISALEQALSYFGMNYAELQTAYAAEKERIEIAMREHYKKAEEEYQKRLAANR